MKSYRARWKVGCGAVSGFTLIELAAIVAVVGFGAVLMAASYSKGHEDARRLKCRENLRRIGAASISIAEANNRLLPDLRGANWPFDMPAAVANAYLAEGLHRNMFYCPSFPEQNNDLLWNFTAQGQTGFRVLGYAFAMKGAGRVVATNICDSLDPREIQVFGQPFLPIPAERPLAADSTLSLGGNVGDRTRNRYAGIAAATPGGHRSAHLLGALPDGGNIVMLDGHVEWRRFERMTVRTQGDPAFWW